MLTTDKLEQTVAGLAFRDWDFAVHYAGSGHVGNALPQLCVTTGRGRQRRVPLHYHMTRTDVEYEAELLTKMLLLEEVDMVMR